MGVETLFKNGIYPRMPTQNIYYHMARNHANRKMPEI